MTTQKILVTGSHNSGTTWVGKMLALADGIGYIHEPFNIAPVKRLRLHNPGLTTAGTDRWFKYITHDSPNVDTYRQRLAHIMNWQYPYWHKLREAGLSKLTVQYSAANVYFWYQRLLGRTPLIKDPIALLSTAWLAAEFDMQIVILIRHPAAYYTSLRRKGWTMHMNTFWEQPLLMRDYLAPYRDEMLKRENGGEAERIAMSWKLFYAIVDIWRTQHPDWLFLRHEDISRDPVNEYRHLYEQLGLQFTDTIQYQIELQSGLRSDDAATVVSEKIQRDSRANITAWKQHVTQQDMTIIRDVVGDVGHRWYADDEW